MELHADETLVFTLHSSSVGHTVFFRASTSSILPGIYPSVVRPVILRAQIRWLVFHPLEPWRIHRGCQGHCLWWLKLESLVLDLGPTHFRLPHQTSDMPAPPLDHPLPCAGSPEGSGPRRPIPTLVGGTNPHLYLSHPGFPAPCRGTASGNPQGSLTWWWLPALLESSGLYG